MEFFQNSLNIAGSCVVVLCLILVVMKVIWNFGLPYAMLHERFCTKEKHSWSIFPLIEILPLLFAIFIAWITNQSGWLSARSITFYGFVAILISYAHLFLVATIAGIVMHIKQKGK